MRTSKIATCCYCGTRAVLILRGEERHELSCTNCGAPLHELKMLRKDAETSRPAMDRPVKKSMRNAPRPTHPKQPHPRPKKRKKIKKRKGLVREFFEELFDEIEDIFD